MTDNYDWSQHVEKEWTTEAGYPAVVWLTPDEKGGLPHHRCGYVRIPLDHPFVAMEETYTSIPVDVHGGVTFLRKGYELFYRKSETYTHYWIGFDCNHYWDLPINPSKNDGPEFRDPCAMVRDLNYCVANCELLAKACHEAEQKETSNG